jgi:hypothetical protein
MRFLEESLFLVIQSYASVGSPKVLSSKLLMKTFALLLFLVSISSLLVFINSSNGQASPDFSKSAPFLEPSFNKTQVPEIMNENNEHDFFPQVLQSSDSFSSSFPAGTVSGINFSFPNNFYMYVLFNSSFPQQFVSPVCHMLSNLIIPQLTEEFWTPQVNYTLIIYNMTMNDAYGAAGLQSVKTDSNGHATDVTANFYVDLSRDLSNDGRLYSWVWAHEFTHIFQYSVHQLGISWVTEAQANLMITLVSGPSTTEYICFNNPIANAVNPIPYLSSMEPDQGVAVYLNCIGFFRGLGYDREVSWIRLFVLDNQILKKFNGMLSLLPYYWTTQQRGNEETIERKILTDLIAKDVLGSTPSSTWLDAYGFCDLSNITIGKHYVEWEMSYQNLDDNGLVLVAPSVSITNNRTVVFEDVNFTIQTFDASNGVLLSSMSGKTSLNAADKSAQYTFYSNASFHETFLPSVIGKPAAIIAELKAMTSSGRLIHENRVVFDTSGRSKEFFNSAGILSSQVDYSTAPININTAVLDKLSFVFINGMITISNQTSNTVLPFNSQILALSQNQISSDGIYNITLTCANLTLNATNLIIIDKTDNIILINQTVDLKPPLTQNDYSGSWHTTNFTILLNASDDNGVSETYYRLNDGSIQNFSRNGFPFITLEGSNNTIEYWSTDNAGNEEFPHSILTGIKLDKTAPTGSIIINNGAASTNSTEVSLALSANDPISGLAQMRFSNDGQHYSGWQPYGSSASWILTNGDGIKTVFAQFENNAGLTSTYSSIITLVTAPVTTPTITPTPTFTPTPTPTLSPTPTTPPTVAPTQQPTIAPTQHPVTSKPTAASTASPATSPTPKQTVPEFPSLIITVAAILVSTAILLVGKKSNR